ncbi:MAG: carboxypeptidase regulatory-like domain-containing protein [Acidobacteria bacterium]|nr:carboxypeptidase regulatory-like domain-containing protein [Acidobacteriota bacterium]
MNFLAILLFVFAASVAVRSQADGTSILTGTVYDANGAVILRAVVTAINSKGEKFETSTDDDGVFVLRLPFHKSEATTAKRSKEAKYDIVVSSHGFTRSITKGFVFVPSYKGRMQLDIALEIGPCGDYEGMISDPAMEIDTANPTVVNKINLRPLAEVPHKPEANVGKKRKDNQ